MFAETVGQKTQLHMAGGEGGEALRFFLLHTPPNQDAATTCNVCARLLSSPEPPAVTRAAAAMSVLRTTRYVY